MDTTRAKQIFESNDNIQVLFDGAPVWIEGITDDNTAKITYLENHMHQEVPVYKLVEVNPVNK